MLFALEKRTQASTDPLNDKRLITLQKVLGKLFEQMLGVFSIIAVPTNYHYFIFIHIGFLDFSFVLCKRTTIDILPINRPWHNTNDRNMAKRLG